MIGPSRNEVERYTGSRISPVRIRESQRAGRTIERSNEVKITGKGTRVELLTGIIIPIVKL